MKLNQFKYLPVLAGLVMVVANTGCNKSHRLPSAPNASAEINRCLRLSAKKKYQQSVECLEIVKSRYPAGSKAAEADLLIGDNYFKQKEYLVAAEAYQEFLRRYPFHAQSDYAYFKSGQAYAEEVPKAIDRDQEYLDQAIDSFYAVVRYFPRSEYRDKAQQAYQKARAKKAHRHFYVGRFYYRYQEYLSSVSRFNEVIQKYPGLGFDEKSFYYLTMAYFKTKQYDKARQTFLTFEKNFPDSSLVKKTRAKLLSVKL